MRIGEPIKNKAKRKQQHLFKVANRCEQAVASSEFLLGVERVFDPVPDRGSQGTGSAPDRFGY